MFAPAYTKGIPSALLGPILKVDAKVRVVKGVRANGYIARLLDILPGLAKSKLLRVLSTLRLRRKALEAKQALPQRKQELQQVVCSVLHAGAAIELGVGLWGAESRSTPTWPHSPISRQLRSTQPSLLR